MTREQMKSHFVVHTNGQDEWIRVDKRTYEKAIDKFCDAHEAELKAKDGRIAELEAELKVYKAKLNSLGKHCEEQESIIFAQNINNQCFSHNHSYNQGKVYVYQDILQKLEIDEEEGKEQWGE